MSGLDRIAKEYKDIIRNPIGNCGETVGLFDENDFSRWRVSLLGPKDTSYKGGLFYLSINFPNDYPTKPPEVCFMTPIYHVNVNHKAPKFPGSESLGLDSLSTLNWGKPEYTMREVLTNIFAFFYLANPDSPYGLERADEFRENRAVYEEKIKLFTKKFANPMRGNKPCDPNKDWDFTL